MPRDHDEMYNHQDLLTFDPNLIIQHLHANINHNYFEFAGLTFQQVNGTAMGAAFSPTVANIFMSVIIKRFLNTLPDAPILLKQYSDDIFVLWPSLTPSLTFQYTISTQAVDFLITIYKGDTFNDTNHLVNTFQKSQNLYQYLHYSSSHTRAIYKGLRIHSLYIYAPTPPSLKSSLSFPISST